ncbi:hypothetical protein NQ315_013905 [Exocentrus adspersus]|uniref:Tyr recombinase domain-containing protein n=1 Tax=Exocentrus adspersus TaxID=1586481 RepID=A0AAV8V6R3_9CUCU|nr:hypothetical protein NQ315_013905 [Exocentrus adspersus]
MLLTIDSYLQRYLALIFGTAGTCRSHELRDLEINNAENLEKTLLVTIPNTQTHTPRSFTVTSNYYNICKKYTG